MERPDDVAARLRLRAAGWGVKPVAAELGCSKGRARPSIRQHGWKP
jgi:hypothetical protein